MESKYKWNRKHQERISQLEVPKPNDRLKGFSLYLNGGTALDIACGLGGNSLFLATRNYQVQAIDISDVAIHYLKEQATKQKLAIDPQVRDLTTANQLLRKKGPFDLVIITYYLDRTIYPLIKNILNKDGYFYMETYYQSPMQQVQGVSNQYKLQPQELLKEFADWNIIFFEENEHEGRQTLFCKKISQ